MSDFPRGWTLTNFTGAAAASITVPAIAGVVHVLDAFDFKLTNNGAGAGTAVQVQLSSSDGVFTAFPIGSAIVAATVITADSASGSGLDLAAGPGASLTIFCNVAAAGGIFEALVVQGHDI